MAISSPLLETSIEGATGVIISISASPDIGLEDVDLACQMITDECSADANVIFGVAFDQELEDEMRITIIATGFTKMKDGAQVANKEDKQAEAENAGNAGGLDFGDWFN